MIILEKDKMQTININIKNKDIRDKIIWFLKHLKIPEIEQIKKDFRERIS
ncbi:MAG: hypothetical protein NUV76_01560 [Candidatus Kuenenia sp.]|nr:hypothetical protein [Candidatus Kuenenia sp.]